MMTSSNPTSTATDTITTITTDYHQSDVHSYNTISNMFAKLCVLVAVLAVASGMNILIMKEDKMKELIIDDLLHAIS